jgi:hypothetical protein
MIKFAKYGLPIFLGPMVTAGGSGPVTLAGAISLQNAEVLMGIVIIHLLNPEQPVAHAGLSHLLDMRSGLCSYGSPEQTLLSVGITQMAKNMGSPADAMYIFQIQIVAISREGMKLRPERLLRWLQEQRCFPSMDTDRWEPSVQEWV